MLGVSLEKGDRVMEETEIRNGRQRLFHSEREENEEIRNQSNAQESCKCCVPSKKQARLKQEQGTALGPRSPSQG